MNEALHNIMTRRSIRKFKDDQVPREVLEKIIEAGLWAPSSMNRQPWHFTVVRGRAATDRLNAELKSAVERMPDNHYKAMVGKDSYYAGYKAPTLIIVSANPADSPMGEADCSCALMNIFLAAHALGVGSCWINQLGSVCGEPGFRAYATGIGVPAANFIHGVAALGYAADDFEPKKPPRKENTVHWAE